VVAIDEIQAEGLGLCSILIDVGEGRSAVRRAMELQCHM